MVWAKHCVCNQWRDTVLGTDWLHKNLLSIMATVYEITKNDNQRELRHD
jgi:hypothetical protein